jgi:hypothetical protein
MVPDKVPDVVVTSTMAPPPNKTMGLAALTAEVNAREVPAVMVRVLVPRPVALPKPIVPTVREVPPVYPLFPDRVSVPLPALISIPAPLIVPENTVETAAPAVKVSPESKIIFPAPERSPTV